MKLIVEDISLAEWRNREGGNALMDKYVHPGQMVMTLFREDGSVFLRSGHPPGELATWTAAQIVKAAQKSNRGI